MVKWKDLPETENSWEWREVLWKYVDKMQEFEEQTLGALKLSFNWRCQGGNKSRGGGCNVFPLGVCLNNERIGCFGHTQHGAAK